VSQWQALWALLARWCVHGWGVAGSTECKFEENELVEGYADMAFSTNDGCVHEGLACESASAVIGMYKHTEGLPQLGPVRHPPGASTVAFLARPATVVL
jgi:hypothetical protein